MTRLNSLIGHLIGPRGCARCFRWLLAHPPSLRPSLPAIRHHNPTLSERSRVNPTDGKVLSPWTTRHPWILLYQYLPPTLSWCFMSASQQVGGEREAGMMASLAAWFRRCSDKPALIASIGGGGEGGKRAKATGTWRNGIAEDGQTRLRDGRTASRLSPPPHPPRWRLDWHTHTHTQALGTDGDIHAHHPLFANTQAAHPSER